MTKLTILITVMEQNERWSLESVTMQKFAWASRIIKASKFLQSLERKTFVFCGRNVFYEINEASQYDLVQTFSN